MTTEEKPTRLSAIVKALREWGAGAKQAMVDENPPVKMAADFLTSGSQSTAELGDVLSGMNVRQQLQTYPKSEAMQQALRNVGMEVGGNAGPIAYHGSPHVFDKFSMSKIGTGEGAQAYGHGLYFTSEPKVAEGYRSGLSLAGVRLGPGVEWEAAKNAMVARLHALADATEDVGASQRARRQANHMRKLAPDVLSPRDMRNIASDYGIKHDDLLTVPPGSFHEVDIPDNLMDYDKTLAEQPEDMRKALEMAFLRNRVDGGMPIDAAVRVVQGPAQEMKVAAILRLMERKGAADVSSQLASAGIKGHSYIGDASGVRNFVIYDDAAIKPLKRASSLEEWLRSKADPSKETP